MSRTTCANRFIGYLREFCKNRENTINPPLVFCTLKSNTTDEDWYRIEKIYDLIQLFDETTIIISGMKYPIVNLYLKNVWQIENLLLS